MLPKSVDHCFRIEHLDGRHKLKQITLLDTSTAQGHSKNFEVEVAILAFRTGI